MENQVFDIIRLVIILAVLVSLIFSYICVLIASYEVYSHTLVRKPGKWGRQISEEGNDELQQMWDKGLEWSEANKDFKKEITITSFDGLKLFAEFYDFGFDKTVVITGGRRECLIYSYFYAFPYKDAGINVLVVDQRAHGLSEGKYATAGINEAKDIIDWCNYIHDNFNQKHIILHGVCVGTCCSINVIRNPKCPDYIKGMILDCVFIDYKEIFGNHMMEQGHKLWPTFPFIWKWFKHFTGCRIEESAPLRYISKVQIPVCFMWGKKDLYCLPEKSEMIWEKCSSKQKEIHWFENGTHSKLRYSEPERYDKIIKDFVNKLTY